MQTVIDNLKEMAVEINNQLEDLLHNHSSIYLWNTPNDSVFIISVYGDYEYNELDDDGRQIQANLLEKYRHFFSLVTVLFQEQPKDTIEELSQADKVLSHTIEQSQTHCKTTDEALGKANQALEIQLRLLNRLYDPSQGEATYVPDTNALLYNPKLEAWKFSETPKFSLVLLPTVLSELDSLKINHRNEEVRNKAEKLIRMIKEYRRRGK